MRLEISRFVLSFHFLIKVTGFVTCIYVMLDRVTELLPAIAKKLQFSDGH